MRKKISRFTSSFSGFLNGQGLNAGTLDGRQEEIRTAMLTALAEVESAQPNAFSQTLVTIAQATDVLSLWDVRSELLRLLADHDGERAARDTLNSITEMFRGLVPGNLLPKRHRLAR